MKLTLLKVLQVRILSLFLCDFWCLPLCTDLTDDESADRRNWVTKKTNFMVKKGFPSSAVYIGRTVDFSACPNLYLPSPFIQHRSRNPEKPVVDMRTFGPAFIHSVVISLTGVRTQLIYRFYSSEKFRKGRSPTKWSDFHYIPCLAFMQNVDKIAIVQQWLGLGNELYREYMFGRQVRKKFAAGEGKMMPKAWYTGRVQSYHHNHGYYILFDNGAHVYMSETELDISLMGN
jgi:hypothetical protein